MSHVHPIQEKKITIKAFKKLKSTVYKLDRDNVGQYLILFTNLGLLYTKWVSLMVTLSDTNSFNIINAWNTNKCLSCDFVKLSVIVSGEFEDYFGSRVEFYKAVEFIFIHLNMSKMITFYKDRNLTIPKPSIENSYVRINVKRFNISRRAIQNSLQTFYLLL
jgi:hypothetical protein